MTEEEVEAACIVMHDAYEAAAAQLGWATQKRSRVPWEEVPEPNKATMRVAVRALSLHLFGMATIEEQVGIATQDGKVLGPINDWAGYRRGELKATHRRSRITSERFTEWEPLS